MKAEIKTIVKVDGKIVLNTESFETKASVGDTVYRGDYKYTIDNVYFRNDKRRFEYCLSGNKRYITSCTDYDFDTEKERLDILIARELSLNEKIINTNKEIRSTKNAIIKLKKKFEECKCLKK